VRDGIVIFWTGGHRKCALVSIQQRIEVRRNRLPLLVGVRWPQDFDGGEKVEFNRGSYALGCEIELVEPALPEVCQ